MSYNPDPKLIDWIKQAAAETHADPVALLATALRESGGLLHGAPGDGGTSFGPFQFHIGGALGNHPRAWASTYAAVLNRANEFNRLGVHRGQGAAAVQRPANRAAYAQGVNSLLPVARGILGTSRAVPAGAKATVTQPPPSLQNETPIQRIAGTDPAAQAAFLDAILNPQSSGTDLLGLVQQARVDSTPPAGSAVSPAGGRAPSAAIPTGKVISGKPKLIGYPNQGTHTLGNWESDNAVDIALPKGTPIRAPYSGVIGNRIGSLGSGGRFAGLRVHLAGAGQELYFAHLSRLAVHAGQHVKEGQIIGYSGVANGVAHLHLGAKTGSPEVYA